MPEATQSYRFGEFTLEIKERQLRRQGRELVLRPKSFETLEYLVVRHGRLVEKSELLNQVWTDTNVTETVLTHCITEVRQALGDNPRVPLYIKTIPRIGYKFIAKVEEAVSRPPKPSEPETKQPIPAIVVLPFSNLSPDPETDYFCDGLTEELINRLTMMRALRVVAHSSSFSFKQRDMDVREIARQLGVGFVLEGSVRKAGGRLRISGQLIDAANGYHLWAEQYDRREDDIFAIQDEISLSIADKLKIGMKAGESTEVGQHHTYNLEAYNLFLKGRSFWQRRYEGFLDKAVECYRLAISKDPRYAQAYLGLADAHITLGAFGFRAPRDVFPAASALAATALEIDPMLAEGYASQALISMFYDWDWVTAEERCVRSLKLNPGCAQVHLFYAHFLSIVDRFEEAFVEIRRAQDLDPVSPVLSANIGWTLYLARRHEEAIEELQKTLELHPHFGIAYFYLGYPYLQLRRYEEAVAAFEMAEKLTGGMPWATESIGYARGLSGNSQQARRILRRSEQQRREKYIPASAIAFVHLGLGETENALEMLERGCEERDPLLPWLKVLPDVDVLRSDARFHNILGRLGLCAVGLAARS
jgi:adenylate cyclase